MTDIQSHVGLVNGDTGAPILELLHDNGDGTYSRVIFIKGGTAGGPATIADGADVTQGAKADPAASDNTSSWSIVALLKGIWGRLRGGQQTSANSLPVVLPSDQTVPVSGTFWQATQPVSAAALPLPTGAATTAKQPALGTAGTPSADVLSVQGASSMTPLKVDGSGVTQPVSGSVAASTVGSASFSGAGTQAATGGGAALNSGTSLACNEVLVQNDPGSTANLKVGSSTAQPIVLTAGQSINFHVTNVNIIYITSIGTATANWLARS